MNKKLSTISILITLLIAGCGSSSTEKRDPRLDTKISGVIFEDKNMNGVQDNSEAGTDKIKLSIVDGAGNDYNVQTDSNGKFHISKVEPGIALITIDNSSLPTDARLIDKNVIEYPVTQFVLNTINPISYRFPEINNELESKEQDITDENGTLLIDAEVVSTDENNETISTAIEAGNTLPDNNETNITNIIIKVGEVHGRIFLDYDESYDYSTGDEGIEGIDVNIIDMSGMAHKVVTDKRGIYTAKEIPAGNAIVQISDKDTIEAFTGRVAKTQTISFFREGRSTQDFIKDANVSVTVVSGERNEAESIGYFATSSTLGLVSGTCFFDSNNNGIYDDTDEKLVGITVNVIDSYGTVYTTETRDERGHVAFKGTFQVAVPPGEVTIIFDKNDDDLPAYKNIIGYEVDKDIAEIGHKTYSGGFGFTNKQ